MSPSKEYLQTVPLGKSLKPLILFGNFEKSGWTEPASLIANRLFGVKAASSSAILANRGAIDASSSATLACSVVI